MNSPSQDYALIIYKNPDLEEIGLTGLTSIMNGGVRITYNRKLCYVNTVDWIALTNKTTHPKVVIKENQVENACPEVCPSHCPRQDNMRPSCWNKNTCQREEIKCGEDSSSAGQKCFTDGVGGQIACSNLCAGGCSPDDPNHCVACKDVLWESDKGERRCQSVCPEPYLKFGNWRCITKSECRRKVISYPGNSIQDIIHFKVHNNECLASCPANFKEAFEGGMATCVNCQDCPKKCNGDLISSLGVLAQFKDCTHIEGDLSIQLSGSNVVQHLSKYLGRIRHISGFLKIARTYAVVSLDFFKSLETIQGRNVYGENKFSLTLMQNENLQKLFPVREDGSTVRIYRTDGNDRAEPGHAFIHYNARLCKGEIKQMIRDTGLWDPGENSADISYATNGEKAACDAHRLWVQTNIINPRMALITWENYKQTIQNEWSEANLRMLLGYAIHYRQIDKATYDYKNLTKYDGRDACGTDDWTVTDRMPSPVENVNGSLYWPNETDSITVKPFAHYAYFISAILLKEYAGSQGVKGAESAITYFDTPPDIPKPPASVSIERSSYSSLNIAWEEPEEPNGIIDHYEITLELNEVNPERLMSERQYCEDKAVDMRLQEMKNTVPEEPKGNETTLTVADTCDCTTCGLFDKPKKKSTNVKMEEEIFFDAVLDRVFSHPTGPILPQLQEGELKRKKRAIQSGNEEENLLDQEESWTSVTPTLVDLEKLARKGNVTVIEDNYSRVPVVTNPFFTSYELPKRRIRYLPDDGGNYYLTYTVRTPGNKRHFLVEGLRHFGSYTVRVRACQKEFDQVTQDLIGGGTSSKVETTKFCSMDVRKDVRTLHKPGADDIPDEVRTIVLNDTSVVLEWTPPPDPNEFITNYQLWYKTKLDSAGSKTCVSAKQFEENGYRFKPDMTGSFYVSVQARSVYGPGNWTEFKPITVPSPVSATVLFIVVPVVIILLTVLSLFGAWQWKKNKEHQKFFQSGFMVSTNGAYVPVSELYKADEWEVDRDRVTILEELGRGAFGKVHRGFFDDPDTSEQIECAVKTVRDGAPHSECIQFLQEAHTMK